MMTKADYDELVRLRALGFDYIERDQNGWQRARKPDGSTRAIRRTILLFMNIAGSINIASAIAEYERAQEGK